MAEQISMPQQGAKTNQLWKTVSELVKAVNALQNMTVTPTGAGKFVPGEGNIVLALNTDDKCLPP
jgi:hypothetical protein